MQLSARCYNDKASKHRRNTRRRRHNFQKSPIPSLVGTQQQERARSAAQRPTLTAWPTTKTNQSGISKCTRRITRDSSVSLEPIARVVCATLNQRAKLANIARRLLIDRHRSLVAKLTHTRHIDRTKKQSNNDAARGETTHVTRQQTYLCSRCCSAASTSTAATTATSLGFAPWAADLRAATCQQAKPVSLYL